MLSSSCVYPPPPFFPFDRAGIQFCKSHGATAVRRSPALCPKIIFSRCVPLCPLLERTPLSLESVPGEGSTITNICEAPAVRETRPFPHVHHEMHSLISWGATRRRIYVKAFCLATGILARRSSSEMAGPLYSPPDNCGEGSADREPGASRIEAAELDADAVVRGAEKCRVEGCGSEPEPDGSRIASCHCGPCILESSGLT